MRGSSDNKHESDLLLGEVKDASSPNRVQTLYHDRLLLSCIHVFFTANFIYSSCTYKSYKSHPCPEEGAVVFHFNVGQVILCCGLESNVVDSYGLDAV